MLTTALAQAGEAIEHCLDDVFADAPESSVSAAMAYATQGGKRLRGFLAIEGARLHGIPLTQSVWAAAAIEALHAYSLVHDDLPAMDDDDLRRGRPTVHVNWDEATAILTGDALQTLAFDLLSRPDCARDPAIRLELVSSLAQAAGWRGMVLGQAQDIAAEAADRPLTLAQVTDLQRNKTGALIRWAAEAGPRLAGADPSAMGSYAEALGSAFQIADDILDVEGNPEEAGKRLDKDAAAGKATFVGLLGLKGAKARAEELVDRACASLDPYGEDAETLRHVARFVISRRS